MRLATILLGDKERAAVIVDDKVIVLSDINRYLNLDHPETLFELIQPEPLATFGNWWGSVDVERLAADLGHPIEGVEFGPLYRHPRKIWGIGLNYVEHASDLHEKAPSSEPASFMKPDTTIIGPRDLIEIPKQSERTTAEAELGVIIGKTCKDVSEDEAEPYIAGYTTIIDMTAEDILQVNPRYLTRSKSFDTFFSFGPEFVTADEIEELSELEVSTVINGNLHRKNKVKNMTFNPLQLVSFHSNVMTLLPGDIISTGTPGAVVIQDGDIVECHIEGFRPLINPVKDLKGRKEESEHGSTIER
ncbi:fumarylacetoacetate hydrolase family protein [Bacillus sp. Marseille-Q3570]|uniref:fumarylacetoacetate hydrolase family protein n=1 Tax=Bacillus sp. Marseille-Q3570 TaxID=2963522 RepID=UPI0021B7C55F|nr:fumarylacetoacetate hydrolase family protein [Bacillus sp. Marseille-Q3570]